jgi:hypothetical protein
MANVLTYDPTPENPEVLSEEEQSSLEVGERLAEEQNQMLAGKFQDAEELEKAYIELQKKLGANETEEEEASEVSDEAEESPEPTATETLIGEASAEWYEKGELTPETVEKFKEMSSEELVSTYIEMQKAGGQAPAPVADITEAEVAEVQQVAGGKDEYANLMTWAAESMPKEDVAAFDALVSTGNSRAIKLAVAGLKAQYETTNGYEGRMLSGKAAATTGDVFRSQAEVVAAMGDPRYDRDPAYRQDVFDKLDRSNVNF